MSKSAQHSLKLEHLSIGYDAPLLKNLSAECFSGITGIVGNNGKGKTTLLRCISGLRSPMSGRILLDEKDFGRLNYVDKARLVSFTFSANPVSFPISVRELVSMGRYPYLNAWAGLRSHDHKIVDEAMELCGITAFAARRVTALSDGERQKAFIAKAIAQQAPLMLFDEPTAFLDHSSKKYFFSLMKKIVAQEQKIIVISSHDIHFLTAYSDNLLMIEDNERVVSGTTDEVTSSSYFKTHFGKL